MKKNLETLTKEVASLEEERNQLFAQREPIDKALEKNYKKLEAAREQRDKLTLELKSKGTPDWEWLLRVTDGDDSMAKHKAKCNALEKIGLQSSGFFPATNQSRIQFYLYKDGSNLQKVKKELETVLPFLKPLPDNNKIRIAIMDRSLSEHGIPEITFDGQKWYFEFTRYHRTSVEKTFASLDEALEYVRDEYWYQVSPGVYSDSEEEEDD